MKTLSAVGSVNISDDLYNYIKDNFKTLQDIYYIVNTNSDDSNVKLFVTMLKIILYKQITFNKDGSIYPKRISNYSLNISKDNICLFGSKLGLLNIKLINESLKNDSNINKSISRQYVRENKIIKTDIKQPIKQTDLSKITYNSREWFDAFYSDANWSPNDIKLGID